MAIYDPSPLKEFNPEPAAQRLPSLHWSSPPPENVSSPSTSPPPAADEIEPLRAARRNATAAFELKYLEKVLARSQGSIARAAALSKVSRQMLQKLMRKHGISMPR
jgi:transcriptional regulator with GAF, ATPase, and Fis domain